MPAPAPAPVVPGIGPAIETESIGHVGRYALKSVLGKGGLGTVYNAWDPLLSRTVALKTLHIDADPAAREAMDALFLNEARAAAGLSHPHIVTVFDAGPSETGVYIAMERLQGQDLRHLLAQGVRPGPVEAAQVVRRVADALAYAHRKGVVHCDIKPANIFMTGRLHPKVLDFGIARVAHRDVPALEGVLAGSPFYLAPEQLDGRSVDRRSDVYSLGVVLYELLLGRKPFEGRSLDEITNAVRKADVVPAHRASPKVPLGLSVIASQAMARDPDQRYPSARHLAMELRHWIDSAEARELRNEARGTPAPARKSALTRAAVPLGALALAAAAGAAYKFVDAPAAPAAAPAVASAPQVASVAAPVPAPASAPVASASAALPDEQASVAEASAAAASADVAAASAVAVADDAAKPADRPIVSKAEAARRRKAAAVATLTQGKSTSAVLAEGVVQLAFTPWGQVEVDGKTMGTSPPLTRLTLPTGTHTITVRNADFPPYSTTFNVDGESPLTLRHRFGP